MNTLPSHGLIDCAHCLPDGVKEFTEGNWRICNDPGAWGSQHPEILVLGFSKGFTQADAFKGKAFDEVAFAGMRPRLRLALERIGVLDGAEDINALFSRTEKRFAFGSLVRCSLSRLDETSGKWSSTGPLIKKSFQENPAQSYISRCVSTYLSTIPESLRLIVLLGNDSGYVKRVKQTLKHLHAETYSDLNEVAFRAAGVCWVHIAHPSGLNGHFNTWLTGPADSTPGRKRHLAVQAVKQAYS